MSIILKKIFCFFLLIIALFTSCNEEIESMANPNPVEGVWNNYYEKTDSLVMTRVFTSDFHSYFIYAEGRVQQQINKQSYTIDQNKIMLANYTQSYAIDRDTLWITNSKGDQETKYIRYY